MKRTVFAVIFLLSLVPTSLYAMRVTSVDDVIRLHRSGVSDEQIRASLERPHEPFEVTPADVVAMNEAGLSTDLIDAVIAAATSTAGDDAAPSEPEATEVAQTSSDVEWCLSFDPPVVLLYPLPYFSPPWLWDPFWYMPRLDSGVGVQGSSSGQSATQTADRSARKTVQTERPRSDTTAAHFEPLRRVTSSRRR